MTVIRRALRIDPDTVRTVRPPPRAPRRAASRTGRLELRQRPAARLARDRGAARTHPALAPGPGIAPALALARRRSVALVRGAVAAQATPATPRRSDTNPLNAKPTGLTVYILSYI